MNTTVNSLKRDQLGCVLLLVLVAVFFFTRGPVFLRYGGAGAGWIFLNKSMASPNTSFAPTAVTILEQTLSIDPASESTLRALSLALGLQKQHERALRIVGRTEQQGENLLLLGEWALERGESREALFWFQKAAEAEPSLAEAWHNQGVLYESLGQPDDARWAYEVAWRHEPALSARRLAALLERLGEPESVERVLQITLQDVDEHHDRWWWWNALGDNLRAQQKWQEALQAYRSGLREFPDEPTLLIGLGWTRYERGDGAAEARTVFQEALAGGHEPGLAQFAIAELMSREGEYAVADQWYGRAIQERPGNRWWYLVRANNARAAGNLKLALQHYRRAVERFPDYANGYYEMARTYLQANRLDNAEQSIERGIQLMDPPHVRFFLLAAKIYETAGQTEQASAAYRDALQLEPDNEVAESGLARVRSGE